MSVDYYIRCEDHKVAVFITDSKGNPVDRREWIYFSYQHVYKGCDLAFAREWETLNDYEIIDLQED